MHIECTYEFTTSQPLTQKQIEAINDLLFYNLPSEDPIGFADVPETVSEISIRETSPLPLS